MADSTRSPLQSQAADGESGQPGSESWTSTSPLEYHVIANRLRWDLRPLRKTLGVLAYIIEDLILLTFDQGRLSAPIAGARGALATHLGRDDSDFEKYWRQIERLRIGFRETYAHGFVYHIDPLVEHWDVDKPKTRQELAREKADLLNAAGQTEFTWAKEDDRKLFQRERLQEGVKAVRAGIGNGLLTEAENSALSSAATAVTPDRAAENSAFVMARPPVAMCPKAENSAFAAPNVRTINGSNVLRTFEVRAGAQEQARLLEIVNEILKGEDSKSESFWRGVAKYFPEQLDAAVGELRERLHRTHLGPLKFSRAKTLTGMLKREIGEELFTAWRHWLKSKRLQPP